MRANPELIAVRVTEDGLRRNVGTAPLDKPKDGKTRGLLEVFLKTQSQWKPLLEGIAAAQDAEDAAQIAIPLVMVMRDDKPRETHILHHGNYETPGERVSAGVPSFLPPLLERVSEPDAARIGSYQVETFVEFLRTLPKAVDAETPLPARGSPAKKKLKGCTVKTKLTGQTSEENSACEQAAIEAIAEMLRQPV